MTMPTELELEIKFEEQWTTLTSVNYPDYEVPVVVLVPAPEKSNEVLRTRDKDYDTTFPQYVELAIAVLFGRKDGFGMLHPVEFRDVGIRHAGTSVLRGAIKLSDVSHWRYLVKPKIETADVDLGYDTADTFL
jgi:hypothetical protein